MISLAPAQSSAARLLEAVFDDVRHKDRRRAGADEERTLATFVPR
jgi:hypothetical protein